MVKTRKIKKRIRVAIIGVGNCASSFLQGLSYYSLHPRSSSAQGDGKYGTIWHPEVFGYKVGDMEVVEAIDVDDRKVGLDLSRAAFAQPNVSYKYFELPSSNLRVREGVMEDPPPPHLRDHLDKKGRTSERISALFRTSKVDLVVNLISSGLDRSSEAYAMAAMKAGACFINATPSPIAVREDIVKGFRDAGLTVVGDDILSQLGGTAFHRGILDFLDGRGIKLARSYQIDVGGGTETMNTINEEIKAMKSQIKTSSITSELGYEFEAVAGTTDYVDYMGNERKSYFWIEGKGFLNSDVKIDIYLRTADGPNAGNILLDVIRATYAAKLMGRSGAPEEICAMGFKKPPRPMKLQDSLKAFAEGYLSR